MTHAYVTDYIFHSNSKVHSDAQWYYNQSCKGSTPALVLELFHSIGEICSNRYGSTSKRHTLIHRLTKQAEFKQLSHGEPPDIVSLPHKTDHYTFNHLAEFAIAEGKIWTKRTGVNWRVIHYEGKTPLFVDCDGANLLVIDAEGNRYYKKVFCEYRRGEIPARKHPHFEGIDLTAYDYYAIDKSQIFNWKKYWFTLPFLGALYYTLTGYDPKIDLKNYRGVAISHRGKWCQYYENHAGKKHINVVGTTTFFMLSKCGRFIEMGDPWVPNFAKIVTPLPANKETYFEAVEFKASGSTLMALGFEHDKKFCVTTMKLYTRLIDVDVTGGNPFFKYSYDVNDSVRVLSPLPEWIEHALPTLPERIFGIAILQIGPGNNGREMRLISKNFISGLGYYTKKIDDLDWEFVRHGDVQLKQAYTPSSTIRTSDGLVKGYWKKKKVIIPCWGPGVEASVMYVEIGNKVCQVYLRKRFSVWNFLGFNWPHVDVILPSQSCNELRLLFEGKTSIPFHLEKIA